MKKQVSIRLDEQHLQLLDELSRQSRMTKTEVLKFALEYLAQSLGTSGSFTGTNLKAGE